MTDTVDKSIDEQLDKILGGFSRNLSEVGNVDDYAESVSEAKQSIKALIDQTVVEGQIKILSNILVHNATVSKKGVGLNREGVVSKLSDLQFKREEAWLKDKS
jgi:hypothetical protein